MDLEKIEKLVNIIEKSSMLEFSIQEGDTKIKMSRRGSAEAPAQPMAVNVSAASSQMEEAEDESYITSPIVGTFCILEAMKLMNEIESEFDCEIEAVLVSNEQKVEYGQPLFKVKKLQA